jgi:tetratricopeptide (TPR) repeat protein
VNNYSAEEKTRLRKQRSEQAITLAMQGKWQEAIEVNRMLVSLFPDDDEAYNRLGKALVELEQYRDGYEAYLKASQLNPANTIAQKNVKRLAHLAEQQPSHATNGNQPPTANPPARTMPTTFIEETGKSGTASLTRLASADVLDRIIPGDSIMLRPEGNTLKAETRTGEYIGAVEPKMAAHLLRFMQAGNRYSAAITSVSEKGVKIIIHEAYQDPSMFGHPSFTAQGLPAAARPYVRNSPLLNIEEDEEFAYEPEYGEEETETEEETEEVPFEEEDDDDVEDNE